MEIENWKTEDLDPYEIRGFNRPEYEEVNREYRRIRSGEKPGHVLYVTDTAKYNFCPWKLTLTKILPKAEVTRLREESGELTVEKFGTKIHQEVSKITTTLPVKKDRYELPELVIRWKYRDAIISGRVDRLVTVRNKILLIEDLKTSRSKTWLPYDIVQCEVYCWILHQITEDSKLKYRISKVNENGKILSKEDYQYSQEKAEVYLENYYKYKVLGESPKLPIDWTSTRCNAGPNGCPYLEVCPVYSSYYSQKKPSKLQ